MANKPISTPLPADLPENWAIGQTVAPAGADVGLSQQHGYNYLMQQVNKAQKAVNDISDAFADLPSSEELEGERGQPGGLATLGADGKLADGQVPSAEKVAYQNAALEGAANVKQALDILQTSVGKVDGAVLTYGEQTVPVSAWSEDTTLAAAGFGYRAAISLPGMTAGHVPTVNFSEVDAGSGNLARTVDGFDGGVYIFARTLPEAAVEVVSAYGLKGGNAP